MATLGTVDGQHPISDLGSRHEQPDHSVAMFAEIPMPDASGARVVPASDASGPWLPDPPPGYVPVGSRGLPAGAGGRAGGCLPGATDADRLSGAVGDHRGGRSEEHTSELQSRQYL